MRRTPALPYAVSVLCLVLVSGWSTSFGAPPVRHRHVRVIESVDPAKEHVTGSDDPIVRQVAVDALGHEKGSVVAVDPATGRILAIVNQKMAFSAGFEPCSTIKPVIALAGLEEGVITRDTMLKIGRRKYMDLTEAMAHSNNTYFEEVGKQLGFERVSKYATLMGLEIGR